MPPFPERESSILAKLKRKKGPGAASALDDGRRDPSSNDINGGVEPTASTVVSPPGLGHPEGPPGVSPLLTYTLCFLQSTPSPSADLLGLRAAPPPAAPQAPSGAGNLLVDVSSDGPATQPSLGPTPEEAFLRYHPPRARGYPSSVCPHLAPPSLSLCLCPPGCRLSWPTSSGHSGLSAAPGHRSLSSPITVSQPALFSLPPPSFSSALLLPVWDWLPATPVFSVCSGIGWPSELEPPAPESPMALLADPAPAAE